VDASGIPEGSEERRGGVGNSPGGGNLEHVGEIVARTVLPTTKLRSCASCGDRFGGRDLHPVRDDNVTFFVGDELCRQCARRHGVL
jgi:hypothetical protein